MGTYLTLRDALVAFESRCLDSILGLSPIAAFSLAIFVPVLLRLSRRIRPPGQLAHVPPSPRSNCPSAESSIRLLCIAQALVCSYFTLLSRLVQGCKCGCRKIWLLLLGSFSCSLLVLCFLAISPDTPHGKTCGGPLISRFTSVSQEYCIASRSCLGNLVC